MNRFTWRSTLCVLPIAISLLVIGMAYHRYTNGEGGFKLGVDLAGGTDLTYEVDRDKFPDADKGANGLPKDFNISDLAASLKRRIDPADLYNVTIRPVGDSRVEIILPTGGHHQTRKEEEFWANLLKEVADKWPPKEYKVPLGNRIELVARINEQYPNEDLATIQKFIKDNYDDKVAGVDANKKEATWKALLEEVAKKWKPNRYEAGRGRVQILLSRVRDQYPDESPKVISDFITTNYSGGKERRALTTEEVERIKALIAQVGSLEFRILANTRDDKDAIDAAEKYFVEAQKDPKDKGRSGGSGGSGQTAPTTDGGPERSLFRHGHRYRPLQLFVGRTGQGRTKVFWSRQCLRRRPGTQCSLEAGRGGTQEGRNLPA